MAAAARAGPAASGRARRGRRGTGARGCARSDGAGTARRSPCLKGSDTRSLQPFPDHLFYTQHQHEDAYWRPHAEWEFSRAALQGASSLRLPALLRFFTGNIGIHHVHHLAPRVANYNLARLQREHELLRDAPTLGIGAALRSVRLKLYDEAGGRMIGWREVRAVRRARHHKRPFGDASHGRGAGDSLMV